MIGTIYRAATGNTIPVPVRDAGSMLLSGLIAGPVGIATEAGELAAEKLTGIDPEKIGDVMLARLGLHPPAPAGVEMAARETTPATAPKNPPTAACAPWSGAQLAAYGVTTGSGDPQLGALRASDVLNSLELDRLAQAAATRYAVTDAGSA